MTKMISTGVFLMLLWAATVVGVSAQQIYTEDFTTTVFQDPGNTTADWNTADGTLKLHPFKPRLQGSLDTPGAARKVSISGDLAFVADHYSGLQVIDISDPSNPIIVGNYSTPANVRDVSVVGGVAYVSDQEFGLVVLDITDPSNPTLLGSYEVPSLAYGVAISGDLVFLAAYSDGVLIIDVSDPTNPTLVGSYAAFNLALSVDVSGDFVCAGDLSQGIHVIDVADPANPTFLGAYATPQFPLEISIVGSHVFVADDSAGLLTINIGDPTNPWLVSAVETGWPVSSLAVSGDIIFAASSSAGLVVFDISDLANLKTLEGYDTPGNAQGVAVAGDLAFVADTGSGLQIVKIRESIDPVVVGTYYNPDVSDVCAVGDIAYFARDNLLISHDISDPAAPFLRDFLHLTSSVNDFEISGNMAYIASPIEGLSVVDVGNSGYTQLVGSHDMGGEIHNISVAGDLAVIAGKSVINGPSWVKTVDISNPLSPTIVGLYDALGNVGCVSLVGNHVFVGGGLDGLLILDISDPTSPTYVSRTPMPEFVNDLVVEGNLLYASIQFVGVRIYNITDPSAPFYVGSYSTTGAAKGIAVEGNRAFLADAQTGLHVIDVSDPTNPGLVGLHDSPGVATAVTVWGNYVLLADGTSGLEIIQIYQNEVESAANQAQSLVVNSGQTEIRYARLQAPNAVGTTWELSADGGANWTSVSADRTTATALVPGNQLIWRATQSWFPGMVPNVPDLKIEWADEFASFVSVTDVADDQGGWLRAEFSRSAYDFADEPFHPVTSYWVHRRVDDASLVSQVLRDGSLIGDPLAANVSPEVRTMGDVRILGDRVFVFNQDKSTSVMPPGVWEAVGTASGMQQDTYTILVPTVADSTSAGVRWSTYCVTTHTTTPSLWFASPPDSTYSVDNLAPGAPQNLTAVYDADGLLLDWGNAPEADFQYFRVYRGNDPGFIPSLNNLMMEGPSSFWADHSTDSWLHYYKITTVDNAGNESEAAVPESVSGVANNAVPARTTLLGAAPNPFNPATVLSFELAKPGHTRLKVYDTAGRLVVSLVDEHRESGPHQVMWDGRDSAGRMSAAGVYLYRLESGSEVLTRRMTLVK